MAYKMPPNPLAQARDVGDFAYATPGAAQFLRSPAYGALSVFGSDGGGSAADILDSAAGKLMEEYVPDYANRAAGAGAFEALGAGRPGSLASAIGGGMAGRLNADISKIDLPIKWEGEAAQALLAREQAKQAALQNQINQMNFGYFTEPLPSEADIAGAGGTTGEGIATPGATPGAVGTSENLTGQGDLPLTPQTSLQITALKAQLHRALKFAQVSPQARQDAYQIYDDMAKAVAADPLAKNELARRQAQEKSNIDIAQHGQTNEQDFSKGVKESVVKMTQDALAQAQDEFHAMAQNPNYSRQLPNLNNPAAIDTFVRNRARAILAQKYAELEAQLRRMGKDPSQYLGEAGAAPVDTGPVPGGAPAGGEVPIPRVGATVRPTEPTDETPPVIAAPPQEREEKAFVPAGLLPGESLDFEKEQATAGANAGLLGQGISQLQEALGYNENSIEGTLGSIEEFYRRGRLGLQNFGRPNKLEDPVLNNTALLDSVLSSSVLQNLSTLIKGNPTEGERHYVEKLGATKDKTKGERRVLIEHAIPLLRARLAFENMRMKALSQGRPIRFSDYEQWLKWAYGDTLGEQIRTGKFGDEDGSK